MLKRVKIQGYKSLADVEVHLQPLSVLFGPNVSGKSNFLDALQLLSRIATSDNLRHAFAPPYRGTPLESFTFGPNGIKDLLAQEKATMFIEVDIELSQKIIDAVNHEIWELEETLKEGGSRMSKMDPNAINKSMVREKCIRYRIEIETHPKTGELSVASEYFTALDAEGTPINGRSLLERDDSFLHLDGRSLVFRYKKDISILSKPLQITLYPYSEAVHQELASWFFFYLEPRERMRIPTAVKEVRHIGMMGEELDAFLNTLHALDERQFRAVEKALHLIVPSITGIDVSVNNSGEVELSLLQGQTPIPSDLLSDGTLRILGLLALGSTKETPALIALEEPENGVHPDRLDLIALLLETLISNDTQVIVTTHSPTLLDFLPRESLYAFRQVNGKTVIGPFSSWRKTKKDKMSDGEEETRAVSELILRGDFYA